MIDIRKVAQDELAKIRATILGFPWEDSRAYAMWLGQTFQMVNYSTRLVALAGAYADIGQNELHARFVDHAREERGHQLICISDMKALGFALRDFPCLYQSAAMYQVQYYWIQHRSAVSFFGYTLALENLAAEFGRAIYERCEGAHGKNATKFLRVHAAEDVDHIAKAFAQLEKLSQSDLALITENLSLSSDLYRGMLTEIQSYLARQPLKRAA